jgi:Transposase DDE domain group 1
VACEGHNNPDQKGIRWMRLSHARRAITARFDDPNLVSCAGLVPVMALADRCGLTRLLTEHVRIGAKGGAHATLKIRAILAGMIAGADSIDDLDLLRHGGMPRLFTGIRAPSTLGTFLRVFTFGHVRQLDAAAARLLARLAGAVPVLPGAESFTILDIDDTVRETHGYASKAPDAATPGSRA